MWITVHVEKQCIETVLKKAYPHPNRYSNKGAACQPRLWVRRVGRQRGRLVLAGSRAVAGFEVPAEAALRRNVLDVAQGKPNLAGRDAGAKGLVSRASADPGQD